MKIALKIVVGIIALLLFFLGLGAVIEPTVSATQFGLTPNDIVGLSTLRSDLGGMFITGGVLLVLGIVRGQTLWFLAVALLMGLIALGRLVGFAVDGFDQRLLMPFLFEIVFVVVLVLAHRQLSTAPEDQAPSVNEGNVSE
ncbi:MAG: DUF4345 family protein [Gammaproteobacteria bacterium]|nr:DUF4345 family protein [Gammaproteobacteria bacterium]